MDPRLLIIKTLQAIEDREITREEAIDLMTGASHLVLELKIHCRSWWSKRALDLAAISLHETADKLKNE